MTFNGMFLLIAAVFALSLVAMPLVRKPGAAGGADAH